MRFKQINILLTLSDLGSKVAWILARPYTIGCPVNNYVLSIYGERKRGKVICSKYQISSVQLVVSIFSTVRVTREITFEGATSVESIPSEVRYVPDLITTMKCYLFFLESLFWVWYIRALWNKHSISFSVTRHSCTLNSVCALNATWVEVHC